MSLSDLMGIVDGIPPAYKDLAVLVVVLSLIEVSPMRLNPWGWLRSFCMLPSRLDSMEAAFEKDRAYRWRREILEHSDSVRKGFLHSKETWDDVMDSMDRYDKYCDSHKDFKNGRTAAASEFLHRMYQQCIERNEFLQ